MLECKASQDSLIPLSNKNRQSQMIKFPMQYAVYSVLHGILRSNH